MSSFRKLSFTLAASLLAASALAGGGDAAGDAKTPEKTEDAGSKSEDQPKTADASGKDKAGKDKAGKEKKEKTGKGKISLPLVEHQPSTGLKIPYYNADGKLDMNFYIGIASRLDGDLVEMSDMKVESFDDQGGPDMDIDLPTSVFNLSTHILVSHTRTKVKRQDFELSGDNIEFNTDTKESNLVGNVKMIIYDLNASAGSAAPNANPTPASAKAPK